MKPIVYIADKFLDYFVEYEATLERIDRLSANYQHNKSTHNSIDLVMNVLLTAQINIDLTSDEFTKLVKKQFKNGDKPYQNLKEFFYYTWIKNSTQSIKCDEINLDNNPTEKAVYFLNKDNDTCTEIEKEKGIVCKGINWKFENFYDTHNFVKIINGTYYQDIDWCSPTNNLIFFDPYLLTNRLGEDKILNVIDIINAFSKRNKQLNVIIVTSNDAENNHLNESKFNQIKNETSCKLQMIVPKELKKNTQKINDRWILTDYSFITIGHPFEVKDTHFSSNFIIANNNRNMILKDFESYSKLLNTTNYFIKNSIDNIGLYVQKYSN
jgi:hypothetical protein